uniref:Odorant receptor n=1 Tax=Globodera rostochiensis TaxID=31243 RepID=A0A914IEE9_GLORO
MDVLFFDSKEYERLYNCSAYHIDQIPLNERQHLLIGAIFIACSIIFEVLYIPCLIAIQKHMDSTCYKFMFYIAITDMMCLPMCGIITGYLAIIGAVFCTAPTFIYIAGAYGLALWITETTAEIFLAFNRCVELSSSWLAQLLFHGKRIYLWLVFPTVYGMYVLTYTKPIIFSSLHSTWFINPHIGYINDGTIYRNDCQSVHDVIVVTVLPGIYLLLALILYFKSRVIKDETNQATSIQSQKKIFIQVLLISSVNAITSGIYVTMQFVPLSEFVLFVAQFFWILAHGIPPVIYLMLNKTVRRDVYILLVRHLAVVFPCITAPCCQSNCSTINECGCVIDDRMTSKFPVLTAQKYLSKTWHED